MKVKKPDFKLKNVKVDELSRHPRNYREHPSDQIEHLVKSIEEHGFYRNVVIAKDNVILAGHGVVKAVRKMGMDTIPVIKLGINSDHPKALKILTGDNEIGHLGEIDDRKLTEILKDIKELDEDGLMGTGFDDAMLANLVYISRPQSEIETLDEAAEWAGLPDFEAGKEGLKVVVHFECEKDRLDFAKKMGVVFTDKTKFIWYPEKERDDVISVRFEG